MSSIDIALYIVNIYVVRLFFQIIDFRSTVAVMNVFSWQR